MKALLEGLRAVYRPQCGLLHVHVDEVYHCNVACLFPRPGYTVCKRTCHTVYYKRSNSLQACPLSCYDYGRHKRYTVYYTATGIYRHIPVVAIFERYHRYTSEPKVPVYGCHFQLAHIPVYRYRNTVYRRYIGVFKGISGSKQIHLSLTSSFEPVWL